MSYKLVRSRAVLAVAAIFFAAMSLAPSSASAHSDPTIFNRIASVRPDLPSSTQLSVFEGDNPELVLANASPQPVYVLDPDGRPYLRVSADGAFGDVGSPYLAATAGVVAQASPAPAGCCPDGQWLRLSGKSGWAWAEPRLDPPIAQNQAGGNRGLANLQQGQPLATWDIGLKQGDQQYTVHGTLERRQPGRLRSEVDSLPDGLTADVIESQVPQVQLTARPGKVVEVIGGDGLPFIRMTRQGALGRTASADYQNSMRALGLPPATGQDWVPMVDSGPTKATWADFRLMYTGQPPATSGTDPVVVKRWRIPVTVDGKPGEISGTTRWEPVVLGPDQPAVAPAKSVGAGGWLIAGGVTLALVAGYVLARRRSAARDETAAEHEAEESHVGQN
ncbi:MAG TPA: hypothetical protein VG674_28225 [Amycolatopsis sp.]|nr:hypothetical protein [Amycolatopsis sp.]